MTTEPTISALMALADKHGAARWATGTAEESHDNRRAKIEDIKAIEARRALESALRSALQGEPAAFIVGPGVSGEPDLCFPDELGNFKGLPRVPLYTTPKAAEPPPGFVLVPKEPTQAMIEAAGDYHANGKWTVADSDIYGGMWRAMLAAAPAAAVKETP